MQNISKYFGNYEIDKLVIFQPDLINLLLISLFIILILASCTKNDSMVDGNELLGVNHTNQLKGIGIFFVVLGHLWVHLSKTKAHIVLSEDAVSLFLLLSGFGLVVSNRNNTIDFKNFCMKRIKRVMIPYWKVTILILVLDYLILGRTVRVDSLMMTLIGINTRLELEHIDYVRWFVTFILLWYILFFLFFLKFRNAYSSISLIAIAFFLFPLNYYFFHFNWNNFFSFPAGCLLAIHHVRLSTFFKKNKAVCSVAAFTGISYVITYKLLISTENIHSVVVAHVPNILLAFTADVNSLIVSVFIIVITSLLIEGKYNSRLLLFLGRYSYEIFLLHGAFLIKYNPILRNHDTYPVIIEFLFFMAFISLISLPVKFPSKGVSAC